jgi:hypothetical protein
MKINWHQNPLRTTVDVDDRDKQMILLAIQNEEYVEILCSLDLWMKGEIKKDTPPTMEDIQKQISRWGEICNMGIDHEDVQMYVSDLQHSHGGDCTCWPATCSKCLAESYLGIDTIKGLGKHEASKIMGAFGEKGDKTIDEALEILRTPYDYEKRHSSWKNYAPEEYAKHIPRWESEKKRAIEWLEKYKEEHGF